MLIHMLSMMGCLFYSMCGFIPYFICVPMIAHTSSIQLTSMVGSIDYFHVASCPFYIAKSQATI